MNRPTPAPGHLVRAALAISRSPSVADAVFAAEADRASVDAIKFLRTKAATVAGTLNASTWGDEIASSEGAVPGFIASLRGASLFYSLAEMADTFPLRKRILATAALQIDTDTGEAGFLPVIAGSFNAFTLAPKTTGAIVVVSEELVNATDPASFAVLQRELQRAAIAAADRLALTEITSGVVAGALDLADPMPGLRTLLNAVNATGSGRLMWMAGATVANGLATAEGTGGRLFPELSPLGGQLLNLPLMVSDTIDPGRLILVDASSFAANAGLIDLDRANGAAIQMKTDPAGAAETVSLFMTNSVALRVVLTMGLEKLRAGVAIADLPGS